MQRQQNPFAPVQRRLHGIAQPDADLLINDQPIHHRLDGVPGLGIELDADPAGQLDQLPVHAGADKAFAGQALDHVAELALLAADHRGQEHHARAWRQGKNLVHDVAGGLAHDGNAGFRAIRLSDMRIEQAEVVVNLRGGSDDGPRAGAGAALLDGDRRGQPLDEVHVGLLHLVQELPGVGGEGLDVLALALGVNGIERQGRLARAAQAGDDHQLVARDAQREVLEIVLTRPADSDECFAHELDGCLDGRFHAAESGSKRGIGSRPCRR